MSRVGGALVAVALMGSAWADGKQDGRWRQLNAEACTPLTENEQARLPATWKPYLSATRRCELTEPGAKSQVALITVFALSFYEGKPATAPWEDFPRPLLVDEEFRPVGGISELFPWDQPATLTLRHGLWKGGIPQEIRVHVDNPAVSGPYDLPVLRWDASQRQYRSVDGPTPRKRRTS
ncbi:hypothetical protein ACQ86G_22910 [Roseateles chitinivorans]|uniref:hypothetical protein n=1 Tax=Roseateles chitinivorans TaxID=2917965 RepID=UPI003D675335